MRSNAKTQVFDENKNSEKQKAKRKYNDVFTSETYVIKHTKWDCYSCHIR